MRRRDFAEPTPQPAHQVLRTLGQNGGGRRDGSRQVPNSRPYRRCGLRSQFGLRLRQLKFGLRRLRLGQFEFGQLGFRLALRWLGSGFKGRDFGALGGRRLLDRQLLGRR